MRRVVQFLPDGAPIHVAPLDVAKRWLAHSTLVPARYALGTGQHETNFKLNEVDTEPSGYVSYGLYQVGDEEMTQVGMPRAQNDPLDLDVITIVMVDLAETRLKRIAAAAGFDVASPPPDALSYLALAHNQGLGACLKTIKLHGLDWAAYKARNPQLADMAAYGDDCVTGGTYRDVLASLG